MWKTPGRIWAQIGPFAHILPSKTDDIHCGAMDLTLFRKPYLRGHKGSSYSLGLENTTTTTKRRWDGQARGRRKLVLKKTLIFFCTGDNYLQSNGRLNFDFSASNGTFSVDRRR
jgi:hypothetical protein